MALQLDVITPERRLLSEQADSVTVPGLGGELGILPGHTPLISALKTGVLSFTQGATMRRLLTLEIVLLLLIPLCASLMAHGYGYR